MRWLSTIIQNPAFLLLEKLKTQAHRRPAKKKRNHMTPLTFKKSEAAKAKQRYAKKNRNEAKRPNIQEDK